MTRLVMLGGSDAGISAALRAKEIDPEAFVSVVLADRFPNYSICGLPFYLSGEVSDWHELAHRTVDEITDAGISLLLEHTARAIDTANRVVTVVSKSGQTKLISYGRLIIATGAESVRPPIPGLKIPGVVLLRSMEDAFAVHEYLATHAPRSAIIIGGGYIGMEMADALTLRGISVTAVEHAGWVLKTIDESLGKFVSAGHYICTR